MGRFPHSAWHGVSHDIRHELSAIALLATLIDRSEGTDPQSKERARQIVRELRWVEELVTAYEDHTERLARDDGPTVVRLDEVAASIVSAIRLANETSVALEAEPVAALVDRLDLWRVLRNLVVNGIQAAGPDGQVIVHVRRDGAAAIVEVHDDGAGYESRGKTSGKTSGKTRGSRGLAIVGQLVQQWGCDLTIITSALGGHGVRLVVPAVVDGIGSPPASADGDRAEPRRSA